MSGTHCSYTLGALRAAYQRCPCASLSPTLLPSAIASLLHQEDQKMPHQVQSPPSTLPIPHTRLKFLTSTLKLNCFLPLSCLPLCTVHLLSLKLGRSVWVAKQLVLTLFRSLSSVNCGRKAAPGAFGRAYPKLFCTEYICFLHRCFYSVISSIW